MLKKKDAIPELKGIRTPLSLFCRFAVETSTHPCADDHGSWQIVNLFSFVK